MSTWQSYLPYAALALLVLNVLVHALLLSIPKQLRSLLSWSLAWLLAPMAAAQAQQYLAPLLAGGSNVGLLAYGLSFTLILATARIVLGLALLLVSFPIGCGLLSMVLGAVVGALVALIQISSLLPVLTSVEQLRALVDQQVGSEYLLSALAALQQVLVDFLPWEQIRR